jgi:hypothetical protein
VIASNDSIGGGVGYRQRWKQSWAALEICTKGARE